MRAVTYLDPRAGAWREGMATVVDGRVRIVADPPEAGMSRLDGVVTGGFTDAHVHLQLVDFGGLAGSALGRVVDLGGNPEVLARAGRASRAVAPHNSGVLTQTHPAEAESGAISADSPELCGATGVEIAFAGAFLTPPGGYPSDCVWAPEGAVREIANGDAAAKAVAEMKAAGASCIKVASNSAAGPVFPDELFREIVTLSARFDLPVVAHAEGPGEAQRVIRLGAAMLAHAPFTQRLTDAEIDAQAASGQWVSTLSIHGGETYAIAVDNVRRFHAAGGTVVYGTDMGNGTTSAELNPHEVAALRDAGIDGSDLMRSLTPVDALAPAARLNFMPGDSPATADPLRARPLTPADLEA